MVIRDELYQLAEENENTVILVNFETRETGKRKALFPQRQGKKRCAEAKQARL